MQLRKQDKYPRETLDSAMALQQDERTLDSLFRGAPKNGISISNIQRSCHF